MEVSIIISARNEFPQLPMTITGLMLDLDNSGIKDYEFIIADNGSDDDTTRFFKFAWKNPFGKHVSFQVTDEYQDHARGLTSSGKVRFCYDPVFSNVGARHKAVQYAKYKNIIFADGHVMVKPGSIKLMLEALDKHKGVIHAPVAWMGADSDSPSPGIQYTYRIGEKIWGTWNKAVVVDNAPFYIPVSGHCFIAINKEEYLGFEGYDTCQQIYGGGENYLDTLYWLFGSNVMVEPRALVYHLSAGRGYSYNMNALIHNMILTAYTLGGEKWSERILITYLNKSGVDKDFMKKVYAETLIEGKDKREFIKERQIMSLDQLLGVGLPNDCDGSCRGEKYRGVSNHAKRPWDIKNEELYGRHHSFVLVFEDWLSRLTDPDAIALYKSSKNQ